MSGARAITESLVLTLVIVASNAVFGASDPGWLSLNPTPYLLVPLLVGVRYGVLAGLIGGLIAAATVCIGAAVFGGQSLSEIFAGSAFTICALPVAGLIAGEINRKIFSKSQTAEQRVAALDVELSRQAADLALAQEAQGQLQEQLALRGAKFSAADIELSHLFDDDAGPVLPSTLVALDELCDIGASAIYRTGSNKGLELECAYGDSGHFPQQLSPDEGAIALAALEEGKLTTCRAMIEAGFPAGDYLAALPWGDDGQQVLLIGDMPFSAANWQNFARAEVFCRWVNATERAGEDGATVLDQSELRERIDLAGKTVAEQGLPSTVVLFTAAAGIGGSFDQGALQSEVIPQLRGSEAIGTVGRKAPHLAVLLPMGGVREAGRLVDAAGEKLQGESFVIESAEGAEEIWKALTDVA